MNEDLELKPSKYGYRACALNPSASNEKRGCDPEEEKLESESRGAALLRQVSGDRDRLLRDF
jgi:hypothetical protein